MPDSEPAHMSVADLVRPQGLCWEIPVAADAQPQTMAVATHLRITAVVLLLAQRQAACHPCPL